MSTFAPLQFLKSAQNPLVWTAIDNGTDTRTSLIIYYGSVNTLPTDTELYEVNCIMMHQAEKQLYANVGTPTTPNWQAFGPGSAFPQPLVPGTFLFTDGATVYWATSLVGQVQYNASNLNTYGILNFNNLLVASNDVPNSRINVDLDVVSLASNITFINSLLANTTFISGISTALLALSSFITNLITTLLANTTFISGITNIVNTSTSTSINLSTQVTGLLPPSNIDIAALEPLLDLGNLGGLLDLSTQVTGVTPLANGGTGQALTDPGYDAAYVWDNTTNTTRLANLADITYDSATNTLTSVSGSQNNSTSFSVFEDFITNVNAADGGLINGDKVGSNGLFVNCSNGGGGGASVLYGSTNHPGTLSMFGGTGDTAFLMLKDTFFDYRPFINGSTLEILSQIPQLATRNFIGYLDSGSWQTSSVHYLGFEFISTGVNSIDVTGKFYDNTGSPVTTSTVSINKTDFYRFKIVVDNAGTSASLYIDGTLLGTLTIATFSVAITPVVCKSDNSFGTPNNTTNVVDYFWAYSNNITR